MSNEIKKGECERGLSRKRNKEKLIKIIKTGKFEMS